MKHSAIYTIGYEKRSPEEFVEQLVTTGVTTLLDVRIRANSRRRGFSKTALSLSCESVGILYVHDKSLGTPERIMEELRLTGQYNWDAYKAHLLNDEDAINRALNLAANGKVCLLCYERDATDCHRHIIADELASRAGLQVSHL